MGNVFVQNVGRITSLHFLEWGGRDDTLMSEDRGWKDLSPLQRAFLSRPIHKRGGGGGGDIHKEFGQKSNIFFISENTVLSIFYANGFTLLLSKSFFIVGGKCSEIAAFK